MTAMPDTAAPFVDLGQPAVEALTRILYFSHATASPPKTEAACQRWLRRQKRQIADLNETSLRRPRTLLLLGDVFFRGCGGLARRRRPQEMLEADGAAALCTSHRRLDPRVLMALMVLVAEEVTVRAEERRGKWDERKRRRGAGGGEEEAAAAAAAAAAAEVWRQSIVKIAVLWMGKRRWEDEMGRSIGDLELPPCARNRGCVACRLAVVGGSAQFLIDLRTGLVARWELAKGQQQVDEPPPPPPPLLRMVEAWIDVCYTRRQRRFVRSESDMMASLLVRLQTGGGGKVSGCRGEHVGRYTKRGRPVPVQVDDELRRSDDDIEEEEEGDTRWRRREKRIPKKHGYSQYQPANLGAVPEPWTVRGGGTATHARRANEDYRRVPPASVQPEYASPRRRRPTPPPPPPPPSSAPPPIEPPWATSDYDSPAAAAAPPAAEPWHAADYDRSIRRESTWSASSSSATLSAIYDAYTTARSITTTMTRTPATSLCAPPPPPPPPSSSISTHRRAAAAAAAGTVSPPSPSEYSPVQQKSSRIATATITPRRETCARAMRPPLPLKQRRLLSEITAPKRVATAAAEAIARPPPLVVARNLI